MGGANGRAKKKNGNGMPDWTPFVSKHAREMNMLPDKAGVFIVGEVKEKDEKGRAVMRTYVVAPYVIGKYNGKAEKFYTLPKGGVENTSDHAVRDGALKEVFEETGIDAKNILADPPKKNGISLVPKGSNRTLEEIEADGKANPNPHKRNKYEGVSRLEKESDIAEFATITYPDKAGTVHKLRMYALWVDGIEHLKDRTKGHIDFMGADGLPHAEKLATDRAAAMGLPSEAEMVQALRTGNLPQTPVLDDSKKDYHQNTYYLFGDDEEVLPQLERAWQAWHAGKGEFGFPLKTPDQIAEAVEYFPEFRPALVKQIKTIRKELEARGSISDESGVKLEDNIRPGAWIAEGADVIPLETYIDRIHEQAKKSEKLIDEGNAYDAEKAFSEAWFKQHGHRHVGEERKGCPHRAHHPTIDADGEAMVLAPFVGSKGLPANMKYGVGSLSGLTYLGKLNKKARQERREADGARDTVYIQDEAQHAERSRVQGKISKMLGEMPTFDRKVIARKDRIDAERDGRGEDEEASRGVG